MLLRTGVTSLLVLVAAAHLAEAGKVKAQVLCGVIVDNKVETVIPAPDKRKLDKPISCAVHLDAGFDVADLNAMLFTDRDSAMKHSGPIGKDADFEKVLAVDDDFAACSDFTITARVLSADRQLWESKIVVKQVCPAAVAARPAVASKPAAPAAGEDGTGWADGELDKVPADARDAINGWITTYVFLDGGFFDSFPTGGVKIGKQTVTRKTARALSDKAGSAYLLTKIMPMFNCKQAEDAMKNPENCAWSKWHALAQSKTELWIYNTDNSFYGPYESAVFKKQGGKWVWTAVKEYDQGEP